MINRSNGASSHGTDSLVGGHHLTYPSIAYDYNTDDGLSNPFFDYFIFVGFAEAGQIVADHSGC